MGDGITITCGYCRHTDDFDKFIRTVTGELPVGSYQCPACRRAWRVEKTPFEKINWRLYSTPNKIVAEQPQL